jgi:hypothetical protein
MPFSSSSTAISFLQCLLTHSCPSHLPTGQLQRAAFSQKRTLVILSAAPPIFTVSASWVFCFDILWPNMSRLWKPISTEIITDVGLLPIKRTPGSISTHCVSLRAAISESIPRNRPRRSVSGARTISYTELTHVELKSAEGDPYFKFPEWAPGSLMFRQHQDQNSDKKSGHGHLLTQFPSTVRSLQPAAALISCCSSCCLAGHCR